MSASLRFTARPTSEVPTVSLSRWLRRFQLWPPALPLVLFLSSLAHALRAAMRRTDGHLVYALDDAYIHMAVAKNFATHGLWGCTPFHFSSSSSSLLWTFILGVAYRAFGVHDVVPLVLNLGFAVLTLTVTDRCLARFQAPPLLRAAALLGLVIALPMPAMLLMGMEHILHALLTIWFAAAAVEALTSPLGEGQARRRQTLALCVLGALLAASRYEGFFLVGLACLGFLARRQFPRAVAIGGAAFLPVAAFGALSVASGGFFLPNSLMLKAAGESVSALSALFKPFGPGDLAFLQNSRGLPILMAIGLIGAVLQWSVHRDLSRPQVLFPALLVMLIVMHGHFVFSPTFWVYRYDAYLVGFGIFATAVVLTGWHGSRALPAGSLAALVMAALVALVANVPEGLVPAIEIDGARQTYLEHYQAAQFIRRYYPSDTVIVNDLGAVTYYTEARILDIAGLGDVEPLEIMRRTGNYTSADVQAWTADYRPAIAIAELGWGWVVPRIPHEWIEVAEVEVPPHQQRIGFFAVDPKQFWVLRTTVQQHYGPLSRTLGYGLKFRRPPARVESRREHASVSAAGGRAAATS